MASGEGAWQVLVDSAAGREFRKLSPDIQDRIRAALSRVAAQFPQGDVKRLKGESGLWRIRVGRWRILVQPDFAANSLTVRHIHPRDKVYR